MKLPFPRDVKAALVSATLLLAFNCFPGVSFAGAIKSVGAMTFANADTLVVADWRGGELHALQLPPVAPSASRPFNLKHLSGALAGALRTSVEHLHIADLALRPGAELAYLSLSIEEEGGISRPALVAVSPEGKVIVIDLGKTRYTSIELKDRPEGKKLWRNLPEESLTVTDVVYAQGRLYVAGLSNARFASTLRVYDFPFSGKATATSVEMYHAVHNQMETRAPIRKMAVVTLNGEPSLVAAYTCTPLVTIPLKDLKDGAHVTGKTIAELGWGSAPVDMVTFDSGEGPVVLLVNSHKSADLMAVSAIAAAAAQPGLSTPVKVPTEPLLGLRSVSLPLAGVVQLSDQDKDFLCALRRDAISGGVELVSVRKGAFLRLSDFVNEFDFADFSYGPQDTWRGVHHTLRTDEGYPELAQRAAP